MAVSNPNTQLIAIICVQGSVGVGQVCYNTTRVLDACKKDGVSYPPQLRPWMLGPN